MVIIITEYFFSSQAILVILDISSFFPPNSISADRDLQPFPKQTRILSHINDHKLVILAASSAKCKMAILSFDFEVKPLAIWFGIIVQSNSQEVEIIVVLVSSFVGVHELVITFHGYVKIRRLKIVLKLEILIFIQWLLKRFVFLLILLIISVGNRPEVSIVFQIFQVLCLSFLLCYRFLAFVFIFTRSNITKKCTVADKDYLFREIKDVLDVFVKKLKYL